MTVGTSRTKSPGTSETKIKPPQGYDPRSKIVLIGASAGGVEAIRQIVVQLPADSPAILITQHMPGAFTEKFARRLDDLSPLIIREATHGAAIRPGHIFVAQGDSHLRVARSGAGYVCELGDDPEVSGHRPSVDVLFQSAADNMRKKSMGIILTGMGRDGAKGLLALRNAGAMTIGQDEATSMIYGMPKFAREIGAVTRQLPLRKIASAIFKESVR